MTWAKSFECHGFVRPCKSRVIGPTLSFYKVAKVDPFPEDVLKYTRKVPKMSDTLFFSRTYFMLKKLSPCEEATQHCIDSVVGRIPHRTAMLNVYGSVSSSRSLMIGRSHTSAFQRKNPKYNSTDEGYALAGCSMCDWRQPHPKKRR